MATILRNSLLVISFITGFSLYSFAQRGEFTLKELVDLQRLSPPEAEAYIINKGYVFSYLEGRKKTYFFGNESDPSNILGFKNTQVVFATKNASTYSRALTDAKNLGFKYEKETIRNNYQTYYYFKGDLVLIFGVINDPNAKSFRNISIGRRSDFVKSSEDED